MLAEGNIGPEELTCSSSPTTRHLRPDSEADPL
jgi:hypothetical protein